MASVPDLLGPDLDVVFCGINPGTVSGRLGQHFARPGNRFWKVLHLAGFTDRLLRPDEQWALLDYKLGVTNLVERVSGSAAEVSTAELRAGAATLAEKAARWNPRWVAVLGAEAYRKGFRRPKAPMGRQPETIGRGSGLWVLPNPSGLQARYQIPDMVTLYGELRRNL
ncbi:MAG TPA: G/U mismatch-specific DNA glycosylase [Acidimicrobiales bacterium]|nr:G/U mismatch-specific DNA glycosylase [Acidimicrobiales bacterium]